MANATGKYSDFKSNSQALNDHKSQPVTTAKWESRHRTTDQAKDNRHGLLLQGKKAFYKPVVVRGETYYDLFTF